MRPELYFVDLMAVFGSHNPTGYNRADVPWVFSSDTNDSPEDIAIAVEVHTRIREIERQAAYCRIQQLLDDELISSRELHILDDELCRSKYNDVPVSGDYQLTARKPPPPILRLDQVTVARFGEIQHRLCS